VNSISISVNGGQIEIPLRALPKSFVHWQCSGRIRSLKRILAGGDPGGFGPHLPVMTTRGIYQPFPVSAAAKGVGLLPREDLLAERTAHFQKLTAEGLAKGWDKSLPMRVQALIDFYKAEDELDVYKIGSLELYGKRTYQNIQHDPRACLLYVDLENGGLSYMVNCVTKIVSAEDPYYQFEKSAHDMFHQPSKKERHIPAAYIFYVSEVYNKTPGKNAGERIV